MGDLITNNIIYSNVPYKNKTDMANDKDKEVKFELAESYFCLNSRGERLTFRCIKRTNKMATFKDMHFDKVVRVGLYANDKGVEYCYPLGKYASKPVLLASDKSDETF